jgi:hypothetical protein
MMVLMRTKSDDIQDDLPLHCGVAIAGAHDVIPPAQPRPRPPPPIRPRRRPDTVRASRTTPPAATWCCSGPD